jgi:hypothetical protein
MVKKREASTMSARRELNATPSSSFSARRCHAKEGGARKACCQNVEAPDKLYNEHKFEKEVVDVAASVMQKWFLDKELGMCRVVEFGGYYNTDMKDIEPVLHYEYMKGDDVNVESSALAEVVQWVNMSQDNL